MAADDETPAPWRRCELAWASWLAARGYVLMRLADADARASGSGAPLVTVGGQTLRAPDIGTLKDGRQEFWEVKYRSRADIDPATGRPEYWMERVALLDYLALAREAPVWIVLHDAGSWLPGGRWLKAEVGLIRSAGRRESRIGSDGSTVDAWVWPSGTMEVVDGPSIDLPLSLAPLVGDCSPDEAEAGAMLRRERELRDAARSDVFARSTVPIAIHDAILADDRAALDVLRRRLGLSEYPRYSVLCIGTGDVDPADLFGLMAYGIRLFLVTGGDLEHGLSQDRLRAWQDARLLEWTQVPGIGSESWREVDGRRQGDRPEWVTRVLAAADVPGGLNLGQYEIVHAPQDDDIVVSAGAGTGKTETMAERIVFLLATCVTRIDPADCRKIFDLRPEDIALVTFTREAASEMRRRIAGTLVLRQRLCPRNTLPATAWLLQFARARVDTVHGFASSMLREDGAVLGVAPNFRVGAATRDFRRMVLESLSKRMTALSRDLGPECPPTHEWVAHIMFLWEKLAENGLLQMSMLHGRQIQPVTWGISDTAQGRLVSETCREVIAEVATHLAEHCRANGVLPMNALVPAALATVEGGSPDADSGPRYLFVDEFQDTDGEQLRLLLAVRRRYAARMFVVGDAKQGIYRFRGAAGDALGSLAGMDTALTLRTLGLTRNFRSGAKLLDSLHPLFSDWGRRGLLVYDQDSRLRPGRCDVDRSSPLAARRLVADEEQSALVRQVEAWLRDHPGQTVAVLCRRNAHALEFSRYLRDAGIPCRLAVGGGFFLCPAVAEARVLLESVMDPDDDAALLELAETRWYPGLCGPVHPEDWPEALVRSWSGSVLPELLSWSARVATLAEAGRLDRSDLEPLRARIRVLAALLKRRSTLGWLMDCVRLLEPAADRSGLAVGVDESIRYARCLGHLVTLLDRTWGEAPISPLRVLEWLKLQIATNRSEDEPLDLGSDGPAVTALTVHKAKGLEFDRVILPRTHTRFELRHQTGDAAVLSGEDGTAVLGWKWKVGSAPISVPPETDPLWAREEDETVREETRLLYVALTRARLETVVFLRQATRAAGRPSSWAGLLQGCLP